MNEQTPANQPFNRREARRQRRAERFGDRSGGGSAFLGLILILLGGAFLLQNMGVLSVSFTNWWALFILLPALGTLQAGLHIYEEAGNRLTMPAVATLLISLVLLLVTATFLFNIDWTWIGPLLLILGGIGTLLAALSKNK